MERTREPTAQQGGHEPGGGRSSSARRAGEQAESFATDAREKGRKVLEDRTRKAGGGLADAAEIFDDAAEELEAKDRTSLAGFARQTADRLSSAAERLQHGDIDAMIGEVRDVARQNPALFLAGAAFAGFVFTRFAKASASDIEEFKAGFQGDGHGA